MSNLKPSGFLILILCFGYIINSQAQYKNPEVLTYISPIPESKYIMPGNNIALRHGVPFDMESITKSLLIIADSRGKILPGKIVLSDDRKTLIYIPLKPFNLGDVINVKLSEGLRTITDKKITPLEFKFFVTDQILSVDQEIIEKYILVQDSMPYNPNRQISSSVKGFGSDSLPEGYVSIEVLVDNGPPEGYYFFTPANQWNLFPETEPFLTITDSYGTPVYYRKLLSAGSDLKIQPNGYLSFYTFYPFWKHHLMDSAYRIIGSYKIGNGYSNTDFHDFQMLENGHYFVMSYDAQLIDMSLIVPGGDPEATVIGFIVQEIDTNDNVIFQWRSWDHFEITETGPEMDLTSDQIDYVHGNTIEVESDTSLLISSRNFHEVTKIHRNTGEIIWRLGGSQNQFEFVGDTLQINRQHDSRRLSNGHISIFDNGTKRAGPKFSSVPEFEIDMNTMTATLINRYRHQPDYFGGAMGNAFWTPDSTIVIGWGTCVPGVTEIDHNGNVLFELQFNGVSYRSYRYPWKSNYFQTSVDSLVFKDFQNEDTVFRTIELFNPQSYDIKITGFHTRTESFFVDNAFPVNVQAGNSVSLNINLVPNSQGYLEDILTLNSDINSDTLIQRISQQVKLIAYQSSGVSLSKPPPFKIITYPNPVKSVYVVENLELAKTFDALIYNSEGICVTQCRILSGKNRVLLKNLSPGVYFVVIRSENGESINRKIVKL